MKRKVTPKKKSRAREKKITTKEKKVAPEEKTVCIFDTMSILAHVYLYAHVCGTNRAPYVVRK